jgi:ClpP class serine protease
MEDLSELGFLAQRLFNTPAMIHPRKGEIVIQRLARRYGISEIIGAEGNRVPLAWFDDGDDEFTAPQESRDPGYDLFNGLAVIPIAGTLVQKRASLRPYSGMTGYNGIRQAFLTAIADPEVKSIAFDINSGGGEVAGCFDLVDTIYAARGEKPIAAILTESAYSAAYAIASSVDPGRIFVPRTGGTGSVAVICAILDASKALEKAGLKVNFITSDSADRKTDGRPEIPLSDEAYAAIKEEIDEMGVIFRETVARNRGITTADVLELKAGTFMGRRGVEMKLADAVAAPDHAFADLLAEIA